MGNAAHQHLLVNHLPVFAPALALPILVLAMLLRKERGLLLAGVLLLVLGAAGGWASIKTGEDAHSFVEDAQTAGKSWTDDVDDAAIAEHESRAGTATWIATGAAVIGLVLLFAAHVRPAENPLPRIWIGLLVVAAAFATAGMGYVANAGGVIVHREIRGDGLDSTAK